MANILSYINWRGDLTFAERPFCEVDNLIFSELSYLDFSGIVPEDGQDGFITVREAAERYGGQPALAINAEKLPQLLYAMAASRRYAEVRLSRYVNLLEPENGTEFSALHAALGDGTVYVAFRGTGDSLTGWREDFSMSFQVMPSQKLAAAYLRRTMEPELRYRVGGHSKGGNLAVYAAMNCPDALQEQLIELYSNDGPGLCSDIVDQAQYHKIEPKLTRIVPGFSVIGALFASSAPDGIVESDAEGILQHDGFSWQVEGDHFKLRSAPEEKSNLYNQTFQRWIASANLAQRRAFTGDLFDALEKSGAHTLSDLARSGTDELEVMILSLIGSQSRTKIVIAKFIRSLWQSVKSIRFTELLREQAVLKELLLLLVGICFLALPEASSRLIGIRCGAMVLYWLGRRQLALLCARSAATPYLREKFVLQMALSCVVAFLAGHTTFVTHFSNLLLSGFFLVKAFFLLRDAYTVRRKSAGTVLQLVLGVGSFLLGIVPVITGSSIPKSYMMSVGSILLFVALGRFLHLVYQNGAKNAALSRSDTAALAEISARESAVLSANAEENGCSVPARQELAV